MFYRIFKILFKMFSPVWQHVGYDDEKFSCSFENNPLYFYSKVFSSKSESMTFLNRFSVNFSEFLSKRFAKYFSFKATRFMWFQKKIRKFEVKVQQNAFQTPENINNFIGIFWNNIYEKWIKSFGIDVCWKLKLDLFAITSRHYLNGKSNNMATVLCKIPFTECTSLVQHMQHTTKLQSQALCFIVMNLRVVQ